MTNASDKPKNKQQPRIKTKYAGVYYRESRTKRYRGQPDRAYLIWYNEGGKSRTKTLGWASDNYTALKAKNERERILAAISGNSASRDINPDLTLTEAADMWFRFRELDGKPVKREKQRYERHLRPSFGVLPIRAITTDMLIQKRKRMQEKLSDESVRKCFAFARACVNHAITESRYGGPNPFSTKNSKFKLPTPDNGALRFLTPQEATTLL
ncbi:MAG: hypothetical protein PQJ28_01840, partial [Spirochaetales bacterium]|nr:hypothetical protein [Spirochaetales bacterium]